MTRPSNKKRVVTDDDIQVLDAHIAYAKTQADRAAGVVAEFERATGEFAGVLADLEQSRTALEQAAGIKRVANDAALVGQPAGNYVLTGTNEYLYWTGNAVQAGSRGPFLDTARYAVARVPNGSDLGVAINAAVTAGQTGIELDGGIYYSSSVKFKVPDAFTISGPSAGRRASIKLLTDLPGADPFIGSLRKGIGYSRGVTLRNLFIDLNKMVDVGIDLGDTVSLTMDNTQIINARVSNIVGDPVAPSKPYNGYCDFRNVLSSGAGGVGLKFKGESNAMHFRQGSANMCDIGFQLLGGTSNIVEIDASGNRINFQIGASGTSMACYTELCDELDYHILPTAVGTSITGFRPSLYLPTSIVDEGKDTIVDGIPWKLGGPAENLAPNGRFREWRDGLPDIPWRAPDANWNGLTKTRVGNRLKLTSTTQFANAKINLQALLAPYAGQRVTVGFMWQPDVTNSLTSRTFAVRSNGVNVPGESGTNEPAAARGYTGATGKSPERHRTVAEQPMWLTFVVPVTPVDMHMIIEVSNTVGSIGDSITLGGWFIALGKDVYPRIDSPPAQIATSISAAPMRVGQDAIIGKAVYKGTGTSSPADWSRLDRDTGIPGVTSIYRSGAPNADSYYFIGNVGATGRMVLGLRGGVFTNLTSELRDDTLTLNMRNGVLIGAWQPHGAGTRTALGFMAFKQGSGTTATYDIYYVTRASNSAYSHVLITASLADLATGLALPLTPSAGSNAVPAGTADLDTTAAKFGPTESKITKVGAASITAPIRADGGISRIFYSAAFTVGYKVTLPDAYDGATVKVTREASSTGAFPLSVGWIPDPVAGTFVELKPLATATSGEFTCDGTAWRLGAYGAL
ncbi:hypothetical protein QR90_06790 [Deinococcus radiopugnans]|uniref:Uncharacterized protein n=1 Tax=Deinococcus radiopugnans TaxID=57497 RepID=A0A0A7KFM8_9DEIO|nr:hypothetical protein [Deinococcus radiopugnans]AIZ44875.1 hypothetical protein QR90_06790 [Deinococcus radiopugnans]